MIISDDRVAHFVAKTLGVQIVPPYTLMGIERDGDVVAGVVFNHWTGPDIHATVAGRGWTRGFLAEVGNYVFGTLKCLRMTAITEQPSVIRLAEKLGGQVEGKMQDHFGRGRPGYVVGILKDNYPW